MFKHVEFLVETELNTQLLSIHRHRLLSSREAQKRLKEARARRVSPVVTSSLIATRLEAIATRLEAIVTRVEAIATSRVEAIATRVEVIATRVEAVEHGSLLLVKRTWGGHTW